MVEPPVKMAVREPELEVREGMRIKAKDLNPAGQLRSYNGATAIVGAFDVDLERWAVTFEHDKRPAHLKIENMEEIKLGT